MSLAKTKLLRLSESISINTVIDAYSRAVKRIHNQRPFIKIEPGTKPASNCVKFCEFARTADKSPTKLMEEALAFFDVEFCKRVCKRPYPMVNFVLSEKTLARLMRQNKATIKVTSKNFDAIAEQYISILETMDRTLAFQAVKGGWPEGAPEVRKVLLRRLKNGN